MAGCVEGLLRALAQAHGVAAADHTDACPVVARAGTRRSQWFSIMGQPACMRVLDHRARRPCWLCMLLQPAGLNASDFCNASTQDKPRLRRLQSLLQHHDIGSLLLWQSQGLSSLH